MNMHDKSMPSHCETAAKHVETILTGLSSGPTARKGRRLQRCLVVVLAMTLLCPPLFAGSIAATAKFSGTAPAPEELSMSADPTCASVHSGPVHSEAVAVNDNGTLKNVFVYVKSGAKAAPAPADPVVIDQQGCMYKPHVMGIQTGQALQILNSDGTLHNVHSMAEKSKQFNLGMPIKGMKLKKKFDTAEVMVKLKCDVHPWMSAYIGVVDHPFFAVSGDNGSASINDLPAGDYTIAAWHETYGEQAQDVTVGDGAVTIEFTFE
jgi:plastocyanin